MTTDFIEAGDEMYARINDVVKANAPDIFGYVPVIYWPNKAQPVKVAGDKSWLRVSRVTVSEEQTAFTDRVSNVRYTDSGLIFIQLFGSISEVSDQKIQRLAVILKNSFKRKPTDCKVIFRNSRINPLNSEDLFFRYNVVFEYEYDTII